MNRIVVHRKPLLLLVSSQSLLCLVVPARDVRTLPDRLPGLVRDRLTRIGITPPVIEDEIAAMAPIIVAKTTDRSVLGILVDFAKSAPYYLPEIDSTDVDLIALEEQFERTPGYASRPFEEVVFPRRKAEQLLLRRWSAA